LAAAEFRASDFDSSHPFELTQVYHKPWGRPDASSNSETHGSFRPVATPGAPLTAGGYSAVYFGAARRTCRSEICSASSRPVGAPSWSTQGIFLIVIGMLWPRLRVTRVMSRTGFFLAIYGCFAAWLANLLGAMWGAGNSMLPIAAGQAHGTRLQEGVIAIALRSAAVALIAVAILIFWGLRTFPARKSANDVT